MTAFAAPLVFANSSDVVVTTLVVVLIFLIAGLSLSLWFYRKNLQLRRSLMFSRQLVKKCPSCNTLMESDANFCPKCGKEVPQVTTTTS